MRELKIYLLLVLVLLMLISCSEDEINNIVNIDDSSILLSSSASNLPGDLTDGSTNSSSSAVLPNNPSSSSSSSVLPNDPFSSSSSSVLPNDPFSSSSSSVLPNDPSSSSSSSNLSDNSSSSIVVDESFSQACVDEINRYRATEGLYPLDRWTEQEDCVIEQAKSDAASGSAHGSFGTCDEWAQNECPNYRSVDGIITTCLQMMWDEGPGEPFIEHGHYINMSSTDYTKVACNYYETSDGKYWSIQNFR